MTAKKLTFTEHLEELRAGIIKSLVFIVASSLIVYTFTDKIFSELVKPLGGTLVFIAPQEAFIANVKIALLGGFYFSSPYILYQLWQFIAAGLRKKEKKVSSVYAFFSFVFFILGSWVGYFIIVPIGIRFLLSFGSSYVIPMISVDKYISFVGLLTLVFGLIFQVPLIMLLLAKIGIVTPQSLSRNRKYAILIIFIAAAILTPPDAVTQCLMAVPLVILYEISIILSRISRR